MSLTQALDLLHLSADGLNGTGLSEYRKEENQLGGKTLILL